MRDFLNLDGTPLGSLAVVVTLYVYTDAEHIDFAEALRTERSLKKPC